jgi:nucleoside-diphosphate-sugar epimerase
MAKTFKVGLIGASGFIGSALTRQLDVEGVDVVLIGKSHDIKDLPLFDFVIDANGNSKKYISKTDPAIDFNLTVASVSNRVHSLRYKTYVFLSSGEVYGPNQYTSTTDEKLSIDNIEKSSYGFHKFVAEKVVTQFADRSLIIRMGGFVGKGLIKNPVYDLLHGHQLRVSGRSVFQFIDVDYAARIIYKLLSSNATGVYNLASTGTIDLSGIAGLIGNGPLKACPNLPFEHHELSTKKINDDLGLMIPTTTFFVQQFLLSSSA